MKLSTRLREAAEVVANKRGYNSMCLAIWKARKGALPLPTEDLVTHLYREDANKYHGRKTGGYWFGPTACSHFYKGTPAEQKEYQQMRVLALLFAACVAEDEEKEWTPRA